MFGEKVRVLLTYTTRNEIAKGFPLRILALFAVKNIIAKERKVYARLDSITGLGG